jgi:cytochrome d ubiquinol oxidase subunit II
MITLWYVLVGFMLITYVVLDGRNFGAGMLHWLVARTPQERRQVVAAVGPLWAWHEVWLVAFGGTLVAVFPRLMATAFSGYYLALFLILWCLILRGIALEVGGHLNDLMWQGFWDFVFVVSSALLALLFGVAGGNLARGVPLDATGNFAMAFFSNFEVEGHVGLLDWYTVSIGLLAMVLLAAHGATYLTLKTEGPVHDRSRTYARWLWIAFTPLLAVFSIESWVVRPQLAAQAFASGWAWMGFAVVAAAAFAIAAGLRGGHERRTFIGSNFLIAGMLATGAATIYPIVLYSTIAPQNSLTVQAVASAPGSLFMALMWWPIAFLLAATYFVLISRKYAGKVSVRRDNQGFY